MIKLDKSKFDFPTTEIYTKEQVLRVQNELIKMVSVVKTIFEKNDIPYFMAYGTLIGAVKFEGFLPWDDDIDLFLFDDSYDKAMECLEKELPKHLIVHGEKNDSNYFLAWNSVKNLNIEVTDNGIYNPDNRLLGFRNLGVDLYRIKRMKASEIEEYKFEEATKFFKRKLKAGIISEDEYNKQIDLLVINRKPSVSLFSELNKDEVIFYFVVKIHSPIRYSDVLPLKKYRFEDIELYGPNNPKGVLSSSFFNIEEMPNYEDRKPHLSKVKFRKE